MSAPLKMYNWVQKHSVGRFSSERISVFVLNLSGKPERYSPASLLFFWEQGIEIGQLALVQTFAFAKSLQYYQQKQTDLCSTIKAAEDQLLHEVFCNIKKC